METLRTEAESWDLVADCTGNLVAVFDTQGRYLFASANHATLLGVDAQRIRGERPDVLIHPDDLPGVIEGIRRILATGGKAVFEFRLHRADGSFVWVSSHAGLHRSLSGETLLIAISRDITEQRALEDRLRQEEEKFRLLAEGTTDVLWMMGLDLKTRYISPAVERALGFTPEEYLSMTVDERLPPESFEIVRTTLQKEMAIARELAAAGKKHAFRFEMKHRHKDGRLAWGEVQASFVYDPSMQIVGINGVTRDIDERKRAEEALAASERRFRQLFDRMHEGFVICRGIRDDQGRLCDLEYLEANPAFHTQTGASGFDPVGRRATLAWAPEDLGLMRAHINQVCGGQFERFEAFTHTFQRWFDISAWQIEGDVFALMFDDITARRRAEEETSRAQRLESIGVLAGGIAHDFNNLLTGILGNLSLVRMMADADSRVPPLLENAEHACLRARDLTQQLLTFSRGGDPVKTDASLPELIRQAADFVLSGTSVSCQYRLSPTGLKAPVDRGQIAQVVQNLVINAIQAMPDGGRIEIAADRVVLTEGSVGSLPSGTYVRFSVRDEGVRIPEEHMERVFDPYFTTREQGTGLGLSVAFSVVRKHGGAITVQSTPGKGSLFTVYLPAGREGAGASDRDAGSAGPLPRRARILLMDDDPGVREVIGRMLAMLGYDHASVRDGAEAVDLYRRHLDQGIPFDGVLMDLTVPGGMGGKAAIRAILDLDPGARAIVMSGYSNDPVMSSHREHGFQGVLPKPIRLADLGSAIERLLGSDASEVPGA